MNIKNLFRKQPKSKNIKSNITLYLNDSEYINKYLDDNKNIIGFKVFNIDNAGSFDFYNSLFINKQIIRIIYNNEELHKYNAIITSIEIINTSTLSIYYTVLNNYMED